MNIGNTNLTALSDQPYAKGDAVTIAIRPEKITLSPKKTTGNCLKVTVEDIAYTGVATYYRVLTEQGQMLKIHQQNSPNTQALDWDETGYASFLPEHTIVLTG